MHISINTDEGLSDLDKQILSVLAGGAVAPAPAAKKAAAAPAKKAAAAKPDPEPDPEDADDSADDADDSTAGTTKEEAVALATKMVANGEAAKVKKALGVVDAKKVSEIPDDRVDEFVAALG